MNAMVLEIADFIQKSAIFEPKSHFLSQKSTRIYEFYATFQLSSQPSTNFYNQIHDFCIKVSAIHHFYRPKSSDFFILSAKIDQLFSSMHFFISKIEPKIVFSSKIYTSHNFFSHFGCQRIKKLHKNRTLQEVRMKSATTKCRRHLKSRQI